MKQLVEEVKKSDADFIVLGGDFNSDPVVNSHETTLTDIKQVIITIVLIIKYQTSQYSSFLALF